MPNRNNGRNSECAPWPDQEGLDMVLACLNRCARRHRGCRSCPRDFKADCRARFDELIRRFVTPEIAAEFINAHKNAWRQWKMTQKKELGPDFVNSSVPFKFW